MLCPIDFRYGRAAMKDLWSKEAKLQRLLLLRTPSLGPAPRARGIPRGGAGAIAAKANIPAVG